MRWREVYKGDSRARALADKHYSRQNPGHPMFTRPGFSQVLYLEGPKGGAVFVWWRPKWESGIKGTERKDKLRAIECTLFRNESGFLSSELIEEACAAVQTWKHATDTEWPDGLITGVSSEKTKRRRSKRARGGECYRRAGWVEFEKAIYPGATADLWLKATTLPPPCAPVWEGRASVPQSKKQPVPLALYNEIEPFAAEWLRNLASAGHIAQGTVDARSIKDLRANDVRLARQAHFFAGIGVWSYALRLAGWPDDRAVWTGSCPCQPFSVAGRKRGLEDERHLWPEWFRLIRECRPPVVFGEQVASPDGLAWLDSVSADLEGEGYAFAAADLCAAGVGAPHIRQRLYFVAYDGREGRREVGADGRGRHEGSGAEGLEQRPLHGGDERRRMADDDAAGRSVVGSPRLSAERDAPRGDDAYGRGEPRELADNADRRWREGRGGERAGRRGDGSPDDSLVGDAAVSRREGQPDERRDGGEERQAAERAGGATRGFWRDAEWIPCRDGKARPVEPGSFPLAHGAPARVGRLRAYGNALVAPLAAEFVASVMDVLGMETKQVGGL